MFKNFLTGDKFMKLKLLSIFSTAMIFAVGNAVADPLNNPWVSCGTIADFKNCEIATKPSANWEYGIAYNSKEPMPAVCTSWNLGTKIANKIPYLIETDNPSAGMSYGGFVFYDGTNSSDECTVDGEFRHRYWKLSNGAVSTFETNGCYGSKSSPQPMTVFCRKR